MRLNVYLEHDETVEPEIVIMINDSVFKTLKLAW